jgi:hypothetical protein
VRRVVCDVVETDLEGDYADYVEGVCVVCSRCGHETESYGTSDASIRRCFVVLRETCPNEEHNFYVDGDEPEEVNR